MENRERSNKVDRPKLPFAQIKREVSIEAVARRYGFDLKKTKNGVGGPCRLPTHESKDSKASFWINVGCNFWICHSNSCQANREGKKGGDVITFVRWMEGSDYYDAAKKLMEDFHVVPYPNGNGATAKPPSAVPANEAREKKPEPHKAEAPLANKLLKFQDGLQKIDHKHEYLRKRGIKPETAQAFGVGHYPGNSSVIKDPYRMVIPIRNAKGELVAYVGRALDDTADKYHFPSGFHKTLELFNLHRVSDQVSTVLVVEGFFDALKLYQAGYQNVVGLMGCTMSKYQEDELARFQNVILMLDGDKAGREGAQAILQRLSHRTFVKVIDLPDGAQPDGLSSAKIKEIIGGLA